MNSFLLILKKIHLAILKNDKYEKNNLFNIFSGGCDFMCAA